MARAQLKSLDSILRSAHEWSVNGTYYHINVYRNLHIGFRSPYKGYLGTEVQVVKQVDRRKNVVPQMYKVLNRLGNPIFSAHRSWFEFIEYDEPEEMPTVQDAALAVAEQSIPAAYMPPAGESSDDIPSINEIQNVVLKSRRNFDHETTMLYWTADEAPEWVDLDKKVEEIKTEVNLLTELSWDQLFEV